MIRRLLLAMGVALLVAPMGTAGAQGYGSANFIAVSDATLFQGQTFTVSGCCYLGDVVVTISSTTVRLGVATANESGNYAINVTIPEDFETGPHTVTATGRDLAGQPLALSTEVTVFAAGTDGAGAGAQDQRKGDMPRTGSDPYGLVRLAAVLIGAGTILTVRQKRMNRQQESVTTGS